MSYKQYLFIIYLSFIFTDISTGLEVCEDHYINCPQDHCGAYPLQPLYRYHCMKTCGVCTNMNRALGKPTAQISTKNGGVSGRAVDGNINNDRTGNSCTKTNETGLNEQWWCVDLQTVYNIDTIKIYNIHGSNNQKNLIGFKVSLGLDGACDDEGFRKSTICYTDLNWKSESVYSINHCNNESPIHLVGRFVFISTTSSLASNRPIPLSICEVGVHTGTKCNSGYFSYNTTTCHPCNTCVESSCDAETGVCMEGCINGYRGVKCDECIPGRFGPACRYACNDTQCVGNCDSETGTCHLCKHGYYGRNCEHTCDDKCIGGECLQLDGSCALEKDREPEHIHPPSGDDTGIDKTGAGFVGFFCGIIIACLALFGYRVFKKRRSRNKQKPIRMTPKPVRPPPIPEDNSTYIPSFESLSSRYIQVTDPDPVTDESGYLASRDVPDSFRRDAKKTEGPRRMSSYSLDHGSRFNASSDKTRKISVYSLSVDNGYVSAQTSRRYSSSDVENRPALELPGVEREEKRESKEEYQDEGYDPYEHVTNI